MFVIRRNRRTTVCLTLGALSLLPACVSMDDQLATLRQYNAISVSPSTSPDYDYSVVLKNLEPLGVSMSQPTDRQNIARAYLGAKCANATVVGETPLATTMPGQGPTVKDYALRVKC